MKAPFPWFGGKSRVAHVVWRAFGDVPNYVEPFAGSLAVLLGRPSTPGTETVNDLDAYVSNFWRALAAAPNDVARWADWPVNEADLHARHRWLIAQSDFRARMLAEPAFFDAKVAGWWAWGLCAWIGTGWCAGAYRQRGDGAPSQQLPHLGDAGMGLHRKLPHLGDAAPSQQLPHLGNAGMGLHRKLPHLGDAGRGQSIAAYLSALSGRLRGVRVACGDWSRVLGDSVTFRHGLTGVLLDPPYPDTEAGYAADDGDVWTDAARWAEENGHHAGLRIALCGYEGQPAPSGWTCLPWKAHGGYGSQGDGDGRDNSRRERIWFSPHCLPSDAIQRPLFAEAR